MSEDTTKQEEFREEQKRQAEAQNQTAENAVPEQRPQSFTEAPDTTSPLTKRLQEEGALPGDEPMPLSAYEKAEKNAKKDKKEPGLKRAAHVGTVVKVHDDADSPHRGRSGAVIRVVSYPSVQDAMVKSLGGAEADYVNPKEVLVAMRGDDRDGERVVLDLEALDGAYDVLPDGAFSGRAFVNGAL